jgi:uncharacterized protein YceH (UPF0502 family)
MNLVLNQIETRVLGSLIEKEITTPEYYPLSLNALCNACNQKSNRDPVMDLSEKDVSIAIDTLRDKKLVWQLSTTGSRVLKYEHNLKSLFTLTKSEIAILCVLILRGPQTIGEIRIRAERMYPFSSLEEAADTLNGLSERDDGPFVTILPKQPGQKEERYMHLFSGIPETTLNTDETDRKVYSDTPAHIPNDSDIRIKTLEDDVSFLKSELAELKRAFFDFKKQLE